MKRIVFAVVLLTIITAGAVAASAGDYDKYLWETPRIKDIPALETNALVSKLEREVQKILDSAPLAPLYLAYGDIPGEGYIIYRERGRIITTLAWAFPHVGKASQELIKEYVGKTLADSSEAPWNPAGLKKRGEGAAREYHGYMNPLGTDPTPSNYLTLHVLYGFWLYGDRTGDWDTLKRYWENLKTFYSKSNSPHNLYGQMGGHIAMARMARVFGDETVLKTAEANLKKDLDTAKDITRIEGRQKRIRFKVFYEERKAPLFPGQPWMFLDASPEIMRFINDFAKDKALERINKFKSMYSIWWLHQSPYFTRWTGDETVGLVTPEAFGMVFPFERWISNTAPEKMALYFRSAPTGIGDCYWIESLVQTIESFGSLEWKSVI